jgi:hypothetical protein
MIVPRLSFAAQIASLLPTKILLLPDQHLLVIFKHFESAQETVPALTIMVLIEIDFSAPNIILFFTLLAILRMSPKFVFAAQIKGVRQ